MKSRKQIDRLFNSGSYFNLPPLRISYIIEAIGNNDELQCGVGVSGKYFKKAVDRNRVKRILREAWRVQISALASLAKTQNKSLKVFIIYTGRELPEYKLIYDKTGLVIARLTSMIDETTSSHT